ncbi:hypothetical protein ACG83_01980 [Frankia sp. R43]|nr:hypothetical protein ACG83_01980 [Frankia sp. R43]
MVHEGSEETFTHSLPPEAGINEDHRDVTQFFQLGTLPVVFPARLGQKHAENFCSILGDEQQGVWGGELRVNPGDAGDIRWAATSGIRPLPHLQGGGKIFAACVADGDRRPARNAHGTMIAGRAFLPGVRSAGATMDRWGNGSRGTGYSVTGCGMTRGGSGVASDGPRLTRWSADSSTRAPYFYTGSTARCGGLLRSTRPSAGSGCGTISTFRGDTARGATPTA